MSETVFKQVNYDLKSLLKFIELGQICLSSESVKLSNISVY